MTTTWVTSLNSKLYKNQTYKKCIDSWININGNKILFSEDGFSLSGFTNKNLKDYSQDISSFSKKRAWYRFYNKALATYVALKETDTRFVIWLDSDIEVLQHLEYSTPIEEGMASIFYPFTDEKIKSLKKSKHTYGADTGMMIFDKEYLNPNFADEYINYWHKGNGLNLDSFKDAWVFCDMSTRYPCKNLMLEYKLLPPGTNYFEYTQFKGILIHYIGGQK